MIFTKLQKILKTIYLLPVYFYRIFLSPIFPNSCRFTPTCSKYFLDAVAKYGIIRGTLKGIWRILRCNPLNKNTNTYDPA